MTPVTCPHCGATLAYHHERHMTACPANPDMAAVYRAALEDPARPGTLRTKPEYEAHRGELYSGTVLMRLWRCYWVGLAAHYGLTHPQAGRAPINWIDRTIRCIGAEMDAEIARNRAEVAGSGESGLPVLRVREVAHGGKVYQYFQIR